MMKRRGKVTISTSISRLADDVVERMVECEAFSNRSNAVETSVLLMHFILNANTILPSVLQLGIKPLPAGGVYEL